MLKLTSPSILIRIENLSLALFGLYIYSLSGLSWTLFFIFILAPDLSMLGYLINPKVGAVSYNVVHNYATAAVIFALAGVWIFTPAETYISLSLILAIHVAFDRALGLGLKYPDAFKPTHLQKI